MPQLDAESTCAMTVRSVLAYARAQLVERQVVWQAVCQLVGDRRTDANLDHRRTHLVTRANGVTPCWTLICLWVSFFLTQSASMAASTAA